MDNITLAAREFIHWFKKEYAITNKDDVKCEYIKKLYIAVEKEDTVETNPYYT